MTKGHEFNIGLNNSTALVAPCRSEIRTFVCNAFSAIRWYAVRMVQKCVFPITFLSVATLSVSKMLGIVLPVWAMALLALFSIAGGLYGCMVILQELGGMKRIMADADEKGGMR